MKKFFCACLILWASINFSFAQSNPDLKFSNTIIQLGSINEDSLPKSGNFGFSNIGTTDFKINTVDVNPELGVVKYSNTLIQSNGKGFVTISVKKGMRVGKFAETIKVYSGKGNIYCNILTLSGTITPREKKFNEYFEYSVGNLSFIHKVQDLKNIKSSQSKTDSILVFNKGKKAIGIGFDSLPSYLVCEAVPDTLGPGKTGAIVVHFNATMKNDFGPVTENLILQTNDIQEPQKPIIIHANILEDFTKMKSSKVKIFPRITMSSYNYNFGLVEKGQEYTYTFNFKNSGTRELLIHKAYCESSWFSTTFAEKTKAGKSGTITVSLKVPILAKGKFSQKMLIISNDSENPVVELLLSGEVK
ncbi:MAG: DUF1573 domain-containing protein [Bacteroidota bacterium]